MALIIALLLLLLAAGTVWAFGSLARRLRRTTVLITAHERLHKDLLRQAADHADIDPFAQTVLDHLRRHTARTSNLKGLT